MTADELKELRHKIKFDMRSMALSLGIPLSTYQRYEDGSAATPDRIERAAMELSNINAVFMAGLPSRVDRSTSNGACE